MSGTQDQRLGCFTLSGDFDPDVISAQLGIEPSWVVRKSGLNEMGRVRLSSKWCLQCPDPDDVGAQIAHLVGTLQLKFPILAALAAKYTADIEVFDYLDGNNRGFFLSAQVIRDLAQINVSIECTHARSERDEIALSEVGVSA